MDKVQSSDTDRFCKCASIVKGGGGANVKERLMRTLYHSWQRVRACSASVWKGSIVMEGEGRRKKIERINEKRKSKSKKNGDS